MSRSLLLLIPAVAACAGEARPNPATVRDSAGIRIVENPGPLWDAGAGWRLGDAPLVDIGEIEGDEEYELAQVRGALRLLPGGVVVVNGATAELRFYDGEGRFVTAAGGEGGGPGEFSSQFGISLWPWAGDSLAVWDSGAQRLTVFDETGDMGRAVSFQTSGRSLPRSVVGVLRNGHLVAYQFNQGFGRPGAVGTVQGTTLEFASYVVDQGVATEIVGLPGNTWWTTRWLDNVISIPLPFHPSGVYAAAGDRLYYSTTEQHEILAYGEDGTLDAIIRQHLERHPMDQTDIDAYVEEQMVRAPPEPDGRQAWRHFFDDMPWPDALPAYSQLKTDRRGALWARVFNGPRDDVPRWYVFDTEGIWLGTITLPERFDVYDIGDDYVLGRWRDELDVEHVQLYELIK